jgi:hypothetical protein
VQVALADLPTYKEYLKPLLDFGDVPPIHTTEFKDGQRIPTLRELLEEVAHSHLHQFAPDSGMLLSVCECD